MRRAFLPAAFAASAASLVACSLLLDTTDLSQPSSVPEGGDAVASSEDAPTKAENENETGTSTDANVVADVDAKRFCDRLDASASLAFCDDFDDGMLGARWTTIDRRGGTLELRDDAVISTPRSLYARTSDAGGEGWATLIEQLGSAGNRIIVDFDLRIDERATSTANGAIIFIVEIVNGDGVKYEVELFANPTGDAYGSLVAVEVHFAPDGGGETYRYLPFSSTPAVGTWVHVTFDVTFAPAGALRVWLDHGNAPVVDTPLTPSFTVGRRQLELGLPYYTTAPWQVRFDNVTCDVR